MHILADELREFTALKYAGDCKCGKCQLVPREVIDRAANELDLLKAAIATMLVGGNHIATWRTDKWPNYGTDPYAALKKFGAGYEYDMWCCWNAIMRARDSIAPRF